MSKTKRYIVIAAFIFAPLGTAAAQEIVSSFDPFQERDAQRREVGAGRTVVVDFNSPLDYAGAVMFCDETAVGSKIYVPKGNGRYPIVKDRKLTTDDLDDPKRTRRVIVSKDGSITGWGGEVSASFRRLVEVSTYESAKAEVPAELAGETLVLANQTLKLAGGKDGDSACFIWSVSKMSSKLIVDNERRVRLSTPGMFIVAGKASFERRAENIRRDDFATIIMSPFKIGASNAPAVVDATIAEGSLREASAAEQEQAEKIADFARDWRALERLSADANVNFSEGVRGKFDRLEEELLNSVPSDN